MTDVDRSLPADIRELARLALTVGLDEIYLGFEGHGADVPAPIGWLLTMTRVDPLYERRSTEHGPDAPAKPLDTMPGYLRATAQIGRDVDAYCGGTAGYWYADEIAAWIRAPRPGIPAFAADEEDALERDADRMITAWKHGWSVRRTLGRDNKAAIERLIPDATGPLGVSFVYSAVNNFYNLEQHPDHRSTGAKLSRDLFLNRSDLGGDNWIYSADGLERIPVHDALALVAQHPPWHAAVAYFDDDAEAWVR